MKALYRFLVLSLVATLLVSGCLADPEKADPQATTSPYVDQLSSSIRGLSEKEIADLSSGAGMGYARPAELNGYPGPLHVLELAEELGLSKQQRDEVQAIREAMLEAAVPLGKEYLEVYAAFEKRFREGSADAETVRVFSDRLGEIDGALRAVHLDAHLTTREVLSEHQRHEYDRLRGYSEGMEHGAHGEGHDH
ncbi:MAG: Spy/CpxP family protein refolding chaperone [Euryarchaeota archaeon]|nr:Spy/CpxP family protein refolding chaperone [Euryarchaeota archaeon]